ncbi:hypothetical protein [Inhella inkyongensis]|nr:hypothetical protein [Inhella inkyongensis]
MKSHLLRSWRSVRAAELWVVAGLVLFLLTERLGVRIDFGAPAYPVRALFFQALMLGLQGMLMLLCWLPAARSVAPHRWRMLRLAGALSLGALLAAWALPSLLAATLGLPPCDVCGKLQPQGKPWTEILSESLILLLLAGLAAGVAELLARRRRNELQLQQLLDEQARLIHEAASARLAARAGRVDPQVLLNDLEAVLKLAGLGSAQAGVALDGLMGQLRQALQSSRRSSP